MLTFVFFFCAGVVLAVDGFDGLLGCPSLTLTSIRSGAKEGLLGVLGAEASEVRSDGRDRPAGRRRADQQSAIKQLPKNQCDDASSRHSVFGGRLPQRLVALRAHLAVGLPFRT